ncbi:MAG: hypothetical protein NTZ32_11500 [Planctomycetales bacterium]|nr:hypothetical protein [Planctomycetales bacterium]
MNPPKILNISAEDLALAKKRQVSIATLSDKYGVHRKTMIKNLNRHGIERYVLRCKKPEDRKTIALDPKDVDALTAKLTSFFKLCQKLFLADPRTTLSKGRLMSSGENPYRPAISPPPVHFSNPLFK